MTCSCRHGWTVIGLGLGSTIRGTCVASSFGTPMLAHDLSLWTRVVTIGLLALVSYPRYGCCPVSCIFLVIVCAQMLYFTFQLCISLFYYCFPLHVVCYFLFAVHPWGLLVIIISYLSVRVVRRSIDPFVGYDVLSYYSFPIIWLMPCPVRFSGRTGWGVTNWYQSIRRTHRMDDSSFSLGDVCMYEALLITHPGIFLV